MAEESIHVQDGRILFGEARMPGEQQKRDDGRRRDGIAYWAIYGLVTRAGNRDRKLNQSFSSAMEWLS